MSNIKIPAWSFSSIKTFDQCPKKYYHLKVAKDFQEDQNAEHLIYGTRFHEAAEFYIRDDKPLPHEFNYAKATLDRLKAFPGEKLCEYEMGLTENLEPCGFKDPNVWWRGIADIIIAKQRNGPTGEFVLTFLGECTRFENHVAEAYGEGVF